MLTVLLIDDEPMSNKLVKMSLEMDGFKVLTAHTLDQARRLLTPDVQGILVDYHLNQNTTGLMLLKDVRQGDTGVAPDTTVIVTSGDDRKRDDANEFGADSFLVKPFSPRHLAELFQRLIAG